MYLPVQVFQTINATTIAKCSIFLLKMLLYKQAHTMAISWPIIFYLYKLLRQSTSIPWPFDFFFLFCLPLDDSCTMSTVNEINQQLELKINQINHSRSELKVGGGPRLIKNLDKQQIK